MRTFVVEPSEIVEPAEATSMNDESPSTTVLDVTIAQLVPEKA